MLRTHIASVCYKCFICFRCTLHSSVSYCKCFVFQKYVQRVMGTCPESRGKRRGEPGASEWTDRACSSLSWFSGPTRTERWRMGAGYACEAGRDGWGQMCPCSSDTTQWQVRAGDRSQGRVMAFLLCRSMKARLGYRPTKSYPIGRVDARNSPRLNIDFIRRGAAPTSSAGKRNKFIRDASLSTVGKSPSAGRVPHLEHMFRMARRTHERMRLLCT
jgi:hypothetical protein